MIIHVDMDAFYASVEERDRPELVGRAVVVGGSADGRGVVAAANYAARTFGIHSAMPAAQAYRLCPQAVFLPPRIKYYADVSRKIRHIFERYTPLVEPLSLDEAFMDARASERLFGSSESIARQIKNDILTELGLVASVGVAPNKFLAKLASDFDKPNGFVVIHEQDIQPFLDPLPVQRLWGVGRVGARVFDELGIHTVGQLRQRSKNWLCGRFGKFGEHLWQLAHGRDERTVVPDRQAKSISHETTFEHDIDDVNVLKSNLLTMTEQVAYRLRQAQLRARTVSLKLRYADFHTLTRAHTLEQPTHATDALWATANRLLDQRLLPLSAPVRLVGVGVSALESTQTNQTDLFAQARDIRRQDVDRLSDDISARFGRGALRRGRTLKP